MPFRFPLEAVLHFRKSVEHQQELRLRAANNQVARARHWIGQIDDRIRRMQATHVRELADGTTSAEIRFSVATQDSLLAQRQIIEKELFRLESLRKQQQRIFEQARRERETFESLRDRQLREYQREQARNEQHVLDDLFLMRRTLMRRTLTKQDTP
jgi:flagellar export protein FliJ